MNVYPFFFSNINDDTQVMSHSRSVAVPNPQKKERRGMNKETNATYDPQAHKLRIFAPEEPPCNG